MNKMQERINKENLRIVFMGTPEFAVETLKALVEGGYHVVAVVTQPDKPVGRHGSVFRAPAVKEYAIEHGLPVLQPERMKDPEFLDQLRSYQADIQVVVAFRMLPEVVWDMPRLGTFNVHASLLPKYRGAAPINWAIINGETQTGVTTFFLDHHIDTGRIIRQKEFYIPEDADVEYVYDGLMRLGSKIALETIDAIIEGNGKIDTVEQNEITGNGSGSSNNLPVAPKIFKETCKIDWSQPVQRVYNFIRGLSPIPTAWSCLKKDNSQDVDVKIFKASKTGRTTDCPAGTIETYDGRLFVATSDEWLEILELQQAGKKKMDATSFLNGYRGVEATFS